MSRRLVAAVAAMCGAALLPAAPDAQGPGKANWLTDGADAQRTSWQRNETILSPATVKNMKLLWTVQTDQPGSCNLFPPRSCATSRRPRGPANRCRRRRVRQPLWNRRGEGDADLEAAF